MNLNHAVVIEYTDLVWVRLSSDAGLWPGQLFRRFSDGDMKAEKGFVEVECCHTRAVVRAVH